MYFCVCIVNDVCISIQCVCISVCVCVRARVRACTHESRVCVPVSRCARVCVSFSADHYLSPWELEGRRGALMATSRPAAAGWRERRQERQRGERDYTHRLTHDDPHPTHSDLLRPSPLLGPRGLAPYDPSLGPLRDAYSEHPTTHLWCIYYTETCFTVHPCCVCGFALVSMLTFCVRCRRHTRTYHSWD